MNVHLYTELYLCRLFCIEWSGTRIEGEEKLVSLSLGPHGTAAWTLVGGGRGTHAGSLRGAWAKERDTV